MVLLIRYMVLLALITGVNHAVLAGEALVCAAASLTHAMGEIRAGFEAAHGHQLRISFGSSGNFARQLQQGAPFEVFLSADEAYIEMLAQQSLTEDGGRVYAVGRLVLFTPGNKKFPIDEDLAGLASVVSNGRLGRLAIANPAYAPYGVAAKAALQSAGVWESLHGKLVIGENAAQAAQFAISGSVDAALIPYSLALVPAVSQRGSFQILAADLYVPVVHRMVLLKQADGAAREFYAYLSSAEARQILARNGFSLTGALARTP